MIRFILIALFPLLCHGQFSFSEVDQLFQEKKYAEAETLLKLHLHQNPDDTKAVELLGDSFGYRSLWDEAIYRYKKLTKSDHKNANYHYKYGGALGMKALKLNKFRALGLLGDIKSSFLKAAELDPDHIETRWALVELYMQLPGIVGGSKKKSLKYAEELQKLSAVDGYLAKGYIYEYDDKPELAEKNYVKAIEVGGSLTCYSKLTGLYEKENQPDKAIQNLENTKAVHPRNALHYQIGKVCADYNLELEKGVYCLQKYIQDYSVEDGVPLEWAYYRLAQIFTHKNEKQEALKWIDKALETQPNFKVAQKERVRILSL